MCIRDSSSTCEVTILPGEPDNPALSELAGDLSVMFDHDLNDGLSASLARQAGLRAVKGLLNAGRETLQLRIEIIVDHGVPAEFDGAAAVEIVQSFDDIERALNGLREELRELIKTLADG